MKLIELRIHGFGKFHDYTLPLSDGLNLIYGRNEAGKSTLHHFLRSMFYGLPSGGSLPAREFRLHIRPWKNPERFGGELLVSYLGERYLIQRDFSAPDEGLSIRSEKLGIPLEEPGRFLSELLCHLTEKGYRNTVSIAQLHAKTDREMAGELRRYVKNMQESKSSSISGERALRFLDEEEGRLRELLDSGAVKELSLLTGEIRNLERELENPRYENRIRRFAALREEARENLAELQRRKEELLRRNSGKEEVLRLSGLSDQEEIEKEEGKAEGLYRALQEEKKSSVLRLLLYPLSRRRKREEAERREALSAVLSTRIGGGEIGEESMERLRSRYRELRGILTELWEGRRVLNAVLSELEKKENAEKGYDEELLRQHELQTELEGKLERLSQLRTRELRLLSSVRENGRIERHLDALSLARERISELSLRISESFGRHLNEKAGRILSEITGGRYCSLFVDDGLELFIGSGERMLKLKELSLGTMDQVYLALRLAVSSLMQEEAPERLPLFLDESFALYDEERLKSCLHFLSDMPGEQILLFSCHKREEEILTAEQLPFRKIELLSEEAEEREPQ